MFGDTMRAIIDLLKLRKDEKKLDLEIEKLQRDKRKEESAIQIAGLDDVQKYDPIARRVKEMVQEQRWERAASHPAAYGGHPWLGFGLLLLVLVAIVYGLYWAWTAIFG